ALHGSLLGLAGAWAALDPLAGVPAFEALDFLDLRRGYEPLLDWLERAIVASDPHLPLLARQRMSGLVRQPMNRQEQVAYSVGDDTRLFVVQGAGDWFDAGQPLRIVAPVSGVASSPWQIVLFVADGSDNT
ncbi:type VI secretion system baseplate subunit TssK, partial [Pseudomonas aeruginosa]|nr:type VI secretion system baseplate subunit TssK [Pseudomonas aeruginosa]